MSLTEAEIEQAAIEYRTALGYAHVVIARVLRELGYMETWGTGYKRMREDCEAGGYPLPEWVELGRVTRTVFRPHPHAVESAEDGLGPTPGTNPGPTRDQARLLSHAREPHSTAELMALLGRHSRTKFRAQVIRPLLNKGWLTMTIAAKPNHPQQRYVATAAGIQALGAAHGSGGDG